MCGTGKYLRKFPDLLRLFLHTNFDISARIPLPPQCAHWGTFSRGEGLRFACKRYFISRTKKPSPVSGAGFVFILRFLRD